MSKRTGSITVVVAVVGAVLTLGGYVYSWGSKIATIQAQASESKIASTEANLRVSQVEKDFIELKTDVKWIKESLDDVNTKTDKLLKFVNIQ